MSNNESLGAAKPTSVNSCALNRGEGLRKTNKAMDSKTRSGHPATGMNNLWKDVGQGLGGNVKGYGK